MSKIKIISDSAGDIRYEAIEKYNIKVLPIKLFFGEELVLDYIDIKYKDFYERLNSCSEIPTTSQISPTDFYDAFKEAAEEGYETVICFTISKAASGTFNNANLAVNMLKEDGINIDVEIVDTLGFSFIYGWPVEIAAKMASEGATKDEILEKIYPMFSRNVALFAVDTLKYLKAGGRIKPAVAAVGEVLDIKPILTIEDGLVNSLEKVRGKKKLISRIVALAEEEGIKNCTDIFILHGADEASAQELKSALEEKLGVTITGTTYVGPTIGVNTGDGVFAVLFFKN